MRMVISADHPPDESVICHSRPKRNKCRNAITPMFINPITAAHLLLILFLTENTTMQTARRSHPFTMRSREYPHFYLRILWVFLLSTAFCVSSAWAVFPQSSVISSVVWDYNSLTSTATGSDLWAITWASDGNQYGIWGDGGGFGGDDVNGRTQWGVARIEGSADNWQGYNVYGGVNPEAPDGLCKA
jgi:hypothetical protein